MISSQDFKIYLIVLVLFGMFDFIYLVLFEEGNNKYIPMHSKIQGSDVSLRYLSAIIAYLLLALGITYFVVNTSKDGWKAIGNGIIFGLVSYGIYNATNYALLKDYELKVAVQDTVWGMFASAGVGGLAMLFV
jgi:uncharacterized membrane protein